MHARIRVYPYLCIWLGTHVCYVCVTSSLQRPPGSNTDWRPRDSPESQSNTRSPPRLARTHKWSIPGHVPAARQPGAITQVCELSLQLQADYKAAGCRSSNVDRAPWFRFASQADRYPHNRSRPWTWRGLGLCIASPNSAPARSNADGVDLSGIRILQRRSHSCHGYAKRGSRSGHSSVSRWVAVKRCSMSQTVHHTNAAVRFQCRNISGLRWNSFGLPPSDAELPR